MKPTPQPVEGITYAPILKKEDGALRWEEQAQKLHDRVRGLTPWPGAFTHVRGQYLKVLRSRLGATAHNAAPGSIIKIDSSAVEVATGQGTLCLVDVQPAGKKRMNAGDYFRGLRLEPNEQLRTESDATPG